MLTILQDASIYTAHDLTLLENYYRQAEVEVLSIKPGKSDTFSGRRVRGLATSF
jgi:hypothetical protein